MHKCIECGKNDANLYESIYCATVPTPSFAYTSIVVLVIYQRYMMSIPLYRQEKDFKRDKIANWMIRSSEYWLKSIYDEMHKQLITSSK